MLPIYNSEGTFLKAISAQTNNPLQELPGYQRVQSVQKKVADRSGFESIPFLIALKLGQKKNSMSNVSVRVITQTGSKYFFLRHPFTPVSSFKTSIEQMTSMSKVQLVYRGKLITDLYQTLYSLDFQQGDPLYAIDRLSLPQKTQVFRIKAFHHKTHQLQSINVKGQETLQSLKMRLAQKFDIPDIKIRISYCGDVLSKDSQQLQEFMIVPNCKLDVIDSRDKSYQDDLHRSVRKAHSRDSMGPQKEIAKVNIKRTDSFEIEDQATLSQHTKK